jgi:hypothetical protein
MVSASARALWTLPLLSCALVLATLSPSLTHAQDAVWVPAPTELRDAWYPPAAAALEAQGVLVREAQSDAEACSAPACAAKVARELGLRLAVLVRVEGDAESAAKRVSVTLVDPERHTGDASVGIVDGDVAAAVRTAYQQAELALELGDQGLLRVQTTPEGALVSIDGEAAGLAPVERRLTAGPHRVVLSLDGFAGEQRSVELGRGRALELHAKLARLALAPTPAGPRKASPLNWIVGGALVLAAAPALVVSLRTLGADGDCAGMRDANGGCPERVHFGARSAALLGLGSAALLAGAYVLIAAPFTIEARADAHGARVAVAGGF